MTAKPPNSDQKVVGKVQETEVIKTPELHLKPTSPRPNLVSDLNVKNSKSNNKLIS